MFIPWKEMETGHLDTTMCKRGGDHKRHHLAVIASQVESGMEFWEQYQVLEKFDTFKYLSMMLLFENIN